MASICDVLAVGVGGAGVGLVMMGCLVTSAGFFVGGGGVASAMGSSVGVVFIELLSFVSMMIRVLFIGTVFLVF